VTRIRLTPSSAEIEFRAGTLLDEAQDSPAAAHIRIQVPTAFERRTGATSIVVPGREVEPSADPALIKAIARGHTWLEQLASGEAATLSDIARRENVTDRYVSSLIKLAFLSPEIVQAAVEGRCPPGVSAKRLTLEMELPLLWREQASLLAVGSTDANGARSGATINGYGESER
jgi:hypothetical protein